MQTELPEVKFQEESAKDVKISRARDKSDCDEYSFPCSSFSSLPHSLSIVSRNN